MTNPTQYWTVDPALAARTSETDRRHDAQGIAPDAPKLTALAAPAVLSEDLRQALVEFCMDVASPDCYGHAMPVEVVRRAARLVKMSEANRKPGYCTPPPARCEACDSE